MMTSPSKSNAASPGRPLSILVLCDDGAWNASNQLDHIRAFVKYSRHKVYTFNPCFLKNAPGLDLNEFDVVVIHWSIVINNSAYLSPELRRRIRDFEGLKIQFLQDDYRRVDEFSACMRDLRVNVLYTLVPHDEIPKVWTEDRLPGVLKISTLAGYVAEDLLQVNPTPIGTRPIDVGYRTRRVPFWLGKFGQEKVWIGDEFLRRAKEYNLHCDISSREEDRLYGKKWIRFLLSCKSVLGTEGGASIVDFDGTIEARVRSYMAEHPRADFEEVHDKILAPHEGFVRFNVISPRIFEAAALHTPMVLFRGNYSGIAQPWTHYIPLEKDFSNMNQVVDRLNDQGFLNSMTERAFADLCASGKYTLREFIRGFDEIIDEHAKPRGSTKKSGYRLARLARLPVAMRLSLQVSLRSADVFRPLKRSLRGGISLALIAGNAVARSLLEHYVLSDRKPARTQDLLHDLALFALLDKIRSGELTPVEPFHTEPVFDLATGRLTFRSTRTHHDECAPLASGITIQELAWDHSEISEGVSYPILKSNPVAIAVGTNGIHRFKALAALGPKFVTWAAETLLQKVGA